MNILYGIVGEGMGHATRSRVVLDHLLSRGHTISVVVSGRAHGFLSGLFQGNDRIRIQEIHGLQLAFDGNELDKSETVWANISEAPGGLLKNIDAYQKVAETGFTPDAVISDFESWAYFYGIAHDIPVISIDNMQIINRCSHSKFASDFRSFSFRLAKFAVKAKLPGAYHYLVTTFFTPEIRKPRTTLIPPILRSEILEAKREKGEHILVYQTAQAASPDLIPILHSLGTEFRVYGLGREGTDQNITFKPFSEAGFIDDLRTSTAVIANGGLSLMGEAVHLHVPFLSFPLEGQYEQELNARYLSHLGYGMMASEPDQATIDAFLHHVESYQNAITGYPSQDNSLLFDCVDDLLARIDRNEPAPDQLTGQQLFQVG